MHRAALGSQTRPRPARAVRPPALCRPAAAALPRLAGPRRSALVPIRASAGPSGGPPAKSSSGWRAFWATVDAGAWLGTVGTAVAFLLTQEALLVGGAIVLPLIALYASRQRGRLDSQAAAAELQAQVAAALRQVAALSEEAAADVAEEVAALVDEVRAGRSSPEKAVRGLESKLAEVEGSVRSAGEATSTALAEAAAQRGRAVKEISSSLGALRRDLSAEIREATGDEIAALGRLDARLAALEGAVSGLEVAQSEGLRRLGSSVNGALSDSRDALAAAVRDEVWSSLEPVRQLPAALAAAAPGLAAAAAGAGAPDEAALRSLVAEEVSAAAERLLEAQRDMLQEAMAAPATVAPAQWNQLGKRLVALDSQLAALKEEQRDRIADLVGAVAADGGGAAEAVAALRAEIAELSTSVADALESQAVAQRAALEATGRPGAAVLELLLAPLDAALAELKQEMANSDENAMSDSERRLQGMVDRVLEAIATARASAASAPTGAESAAESQTAADGIAAVSGRLEGLGAQLEALEARLAAAPVAAPAESVASSAASVTGPSVLSTASPAPTTPNEARDEAERAEAYERMQALLRGGSGDEGDGKKEGAAATGMPISAWLSRDEEEGAEEENSSRQATVVGAAMGGAAAGARNMLIQEQIAFEAGLAAADTVDGDEEQEAGSGSAGAANGAAPAADAPEDSATRASDDENEVLDEAAGEEAIGSAAAPPAAEATSGQQEPVDAEALYSQGLELLRRGRAAAAESPTSWEALENADAALGDATACFQASAGAASGATSVKALGNSGNALMARARVKRLLAEVLAAADGGVASPEGEALLSEARELLVVAGRRYREVLQADGSQGRAFLNWGRAVCLRAELAREAGDGPGARALFENAAEKFQAALQLDAEPAEALRLAGSALASAAAECGDPAEQGRLLEDAEALLTEAVEAGAGPEAEARLDECRAALGW